MKNKIAFVAVLLLLVAAAAFWQWQRTRAPVDSPVVVQADGPTAQGASETGSGSQAAVDNAAALSTAADQANASLPKPYTDGLVMEHALVEGNRLVTEIRIPDVRLGSLKKEMLPVMQRQEQGDLAKFACKDPGLMSLLQRKAEIARRFLDMDRKLIFDVVVTIADCAGAQ